MCMYAGIKTSFNDMYMYMYVKETNKNKESLAPKWECTLLDLSMQHLI